MEETTHQHYFIFNDDGFEVCSLCGLCTSQKEMKEQNETQTNFDKIKRPEFSYILENVNIGFIQEIEGAYIEIKTTLKRGFPNIYLYAYCTYNVLMKNSVYYSLAQISNIFKIKNFSKYYCQIENKDSKNNNIFFIEDKKYIYSAVNLFLAQVNKKQKFSKAKTIFKKISNLNIKLKQNIFVAVVIFFAISPQKYSIINQLKTDLCENFSVNIRTLSKTIKNVKKCLTQQQLSTI